MYSTSLQSALKLMGEWAAQSTAEQFRQLAPVFEGYGQAVNRDFALMLKPWRQYSPASFKQLLATMPRPKFKMEAAPALSSVEAWIEEVLMEQSTNERMLHSDGESLN